MTRLVAAGLLASLAALAPAASVAHEPGVVIAVMDLGPDTMTLELAMRADELGASIGADLADPQGTADLDRIQAARPRIEAYLARTTVIASGARICPLTLRTLGSELDAVVLIGAVEGCGSDTPGLVYRSTLLHEIHPPPILNLMIFEGDDVGHAVLTITAPETRLTGGRAPALESFARLVRVGIEHIGIGFDHIAFIAALILWARALWPVVKVVTAFTIAHSITLGLAAGGLVMLPASLIEPAIALSIVWAAFENFRNRTIDNRIAPAFVLGLLHGLGFAGALGELGLADHGLLLAVLGFNIGVEIGQIAIVIAVLTALVLGDRLLGHARGEPPTRSPIVVYPLSVLIALAGFAWFVAAL